MRILTSQFDHLRFHIKPFTNDFFYNFLWDLIQKEEGFLKGFEMSNSSFYKWKSLMTSNSQVSGSRHPGLNKHYIFYKGLTRRYVQS